jgi:flagellar hook-associated protein 1
MGVNFSSFDIARRALQANQLGITVTGQNIANVNTPGYSRQKVQLAATPGDGSNLRLTGAGVTIEGVRAHRDDYLETRLNTETALQGRLTARRDTLTQVEGALNEANSASGISAAMTDFFGAFRDLEARPNAITARNVAVEKGNALASAFQTTRARLAEIRRGADKDLRATADEVNTLAEKVAEFNAKISFAHHTGANAHELEDQRNLAVRRLSELAGARTTTDEQGQLTVTVGDCQALVIGNDARKIAAVDTPPDGLAALEISGQSVTITDGKLRGLQDAITEIGTRLTDLDQLAASIADRVNTLSQSGVDLNGNAGAAFFNVPPGGVTAANLSVSAAVKADSKLVVASATGAGTGDGSIARSIAALLTETSSTSGSRAGSFTAIYASVVADAGTSVKSAEDALQTQQIILKQTEAQRDAVSGVSLDEEAINLLQYQRAYEAAAKFLRIADEMTQTILALAQ